MLLALLFATVSARAGSYTVTYSGGAATGEFMPTGSPYSQYQYDSYSGTYGTPTIYAAWGVAVGPNNQQVVTSDTLTCAGTITATFTWQPGSGSSSGGGNIADDPPPKAVVIKEECAASWDSTSDVNCTNPGTGSSSNGLGFSEITWGPDVYPWGVNASGSSAGTRYKIQEEPGASFTVTCSPSATVSGAGSLGPPAASGYGHGYIQYTLLLLHWKSS